MSRTIAVIGAGTCDAQLARTAESVGRLLAQRGCTLVTGGLGGVMEAASRGARAAGGRVLGILPGDSVADANPHVEVPVATGLGEARNLVIVNTAEAFVAVGGAWGTLSEIAFACKRGKPVVGLGTWDVGPGVEAVGTAEEAVERVLARLEEGGGRP